MSSVYLWDTDDGFAGVVLIKKCKLSLIAAFLRSCRPVVGCRQRVCKRDQRLRQHQFAANDDGASTASWDSGASLIFMVSPSRSSSRRLRR